MAITYATTVQLNVQPSQVVQWIRELEVRCAEPRRMRTKKYLLGSWTCQNTECSQRYLIRGGEGRTWITIVVVAIRPGRERPYAILLIREPADPRAGEATMVPQ